MKTILLSALPGLLLASCTQTSVVREPNGSLTFARGGAQAEPTSYWIQGAAPGRVTSAEDLTVFRRYRGKSLPAQAVRCIGWIDARDAARIEVQLAEKRGKQIEPAWICGRHAVTDPQAPKPFYHRLIP